MNFFQKSTLITLSLVATSIPQWVSACSVAFWNNNSQAKVVARSVDLYMSDEPMLVVLPRGIDKDGSSGENSARWKSKYGSLVVTAFHTTTATDGMNEQGLTGHLLYLDGTEYEKRDVAKPGITNGIWLQYALDNYKSVSEAVEGLKSLQVTSIPIGGREWPLHLALEDASGDSAIFEFIKGKLTIHHGPQYTVMTNEPAFSIQLENLKKYKLFGGKLSMPGDIDPLSRFVRLASYIKTLPEPKTYVDAVAGVYSVMRSAMVPFGAEDTSSGISTDTWPTRWVSLQDLSNKIYYFSSTLAPNVIWVDFKNLRFSEGSSTLQLDPTNIALTGEVSKSLKALR